jgi:hypothetical protein
MSRSLPQANYDGQNEECEPDNYTKYSNQIQTKKYTLNQYKGQRNMKPDVKQDVRLIRILTGSYFN